MERRRGIGELEEVRTDEERRTAGAKREQHTPTHITNSLLLVTSLPPARSHRRFTGMLAGTWRLI